jgi:hypothetical protein
VSKPVVYTISAVILEERVIGEVFSILDAVGLGRFGHDLRQCKPGSMIVVTGKRRDFSTSCCLDHSLKYDKSYTE